MTIPTRIGQQWAGEKFAGFIRRSHAIECVTTRFTITGNLSLGDLYNGAHGENLHVPTSEHALVVLLAFSRENCVDSANSIQDVQHLAANAHYAVLTHTHGCVVPRTADKFFISTSSGVAIGSNRGTFVPQSFVPPSKISTIFVSTHFI